MTLPLRFIPGCEYSLDIETLENPPLEGSTADELIRSLSAYEGELLPGFLPGMGFSRSAIACTPSSRPR